MSTPRCILLVVVILAGTAACDNNNNETGKAVLVIADKYELDGIFRIGTPQGFEWAKTDEDEFEDFTHHVYRCTKRDGTLIPHVLLVITEISDDYIIDIDTELAAGYSQLVRLMLDVGATDTKYVAPAPHEGKKGVYEYAVSGTIPEKGRMSISCSMRIDSNSTRIFQLQAIADSDESADQLRNLFYTLEPIANTPDRKKAPED